MMLSVERLRCSYISMNRSRSTAWTPKAAPTFRNERLRGDGNRSAAVDGTELGKLDRRTWDSPRETLPPGALAENGDPEFRAETYLTDTVVADIGTSLSRRPGNASSM